MKLNKIKFMNRTKLRLILFLIGLVFLVVGNILIYINNLTIGGIFTLGILLLLRFFPYRIYFFPTKPDPKDLFIQEVKQFFNENIN